jgi:hypothetical protein
MGESETKAWGMGEECEIELKGSHIVQNLVCMKNWLYDRLWLLEIFLCLILLRNIGILFDISFREGPWDSNLRLRALPPLQHYHPYSLC